MTVTVTVSFSSSPLIPKKGIEKFYIYILYKYNYLIILFSHLSLLEGKVAENETVTVTVTFRGSLGGDERVLSCL